MDCRDFNFHHLGNYKDINESVEGKHVSHLLSATTAALDKGRAE